MEAYIDGLLEGSYFLAAVAELEERDESEWQLKRKNHLHQRRKKSGTKLISQPGD